MPLIYIFKKKKKDSTLKFTLGLYMYRTILSWPRGNAPPQHASHRSCVPVIYSFQAQGCALKSENPIVYCP